MSIDTLGKFQVLETLGTGANSTILRIRRADDGREYALKVVPIESAEDEKFLDQAKHEIRVSNMLKHPHLIKVHHIEVEGGGWFSKKKTARLLVEYVNGKTLDKFPMMRPYRLIRIFEQVADGLVHMHKQGVLHADLKPNNIMVARGPTAKVIDYGLSWIKGEPKDRVQGTPEYMAPETATHKLVNERTDIYNFGATMYKAATLQLPPCVVPSADGFQLSEKMFKENLKPVGEINRGVPKELCDLIHHCLQYNALKRPERMSVIQGELDRLAEAEAAKLDPADLEE